MATPDTLHVFAAGNAAANLDVTTLNNYPSADAPNLSNMLVVNAVTITSTPMYTSKFMNVLPSPAPFPNWQCPIHKG